MASRQQTDFMLKDDGTYVCALWCEEGSVSVRSAVCRACRIAEATNYVINCAYAWYEATAMGYGEEELVKVTAMELQEAIEEREVVLSER